MKDKVTEYNTTSVFTTEEMHNVPYIKLSPCYKYLAVASISKFVYIYDITQPNNMILLVSYDLLSYLWNVQWIIKEGTKTSNITLNDYLLLVTSNKKFYLLDIPIKNDGITLRLLDRIEGRPVFHSSMTRLYLCKHIPEIDLFIYHLQFTSEFYLLWIVKIENGYFWNNEDKYVLNKESYNLGDMVNCNQIFVLGLDAYYQNDIITIFFNTINNDVIKIEFSLSKELRIHSNTIKIEQTSVTCNLPNSFK